MLICEELEELDEVDADEPVQAEADALRSGELELPLELIGVPFN
jgi:hypothetical protein